MPKLPLDRNPKHRRHVLGYGYVVLGGEQSYTGRWPDAAQTAPPETVARYLELVGRWNALGRKPLPRATEAVPTIADLCDRWAAHCAGYYRKADERGRQRVTQNGHNCRRVARTVKRLFGSLPIARFDRDHFKTLRGHYVNVPNGQSRPAAHDIRHNCRKTVNHSLMLARQMFAWGVDERLVPATVYAELVVPIGLKKGRTDAADRPPVPPAPLTVRRAIRRVAQPKIRAMIALQCLTGLRPSEVCALRPYLLDRSVQPWIYRVPAWANKTEHHDKARVVFIGRRAQRFLEPFLARTPGPKDPIFRTVDGRSYTTRSYGTYIRDVCKRLGIEPCPPNRFRKYALTKIRARFGAEYAQSVGGHSDLKTTEAYYAPVGEQKAREVARRRG